MTAKEPHYSRTRTRGTSTRTRGTGTRTRGTRTRGATRTRTNATAARRVASSFRYTLADWTHRATQWMIDTVTPGGWLLLTVILLALLIGLPLGWVELVAPGVMAAVLVVLSLFFLIGKKNLHVDLEIGTDRVVVGRLVEASLSASNIGKGARMPTHLDVPVGEELVEIPLPFMRAGAEISQSISIPTSKRGVIPVGPVSLTKTSPIGIVSSDMTWGKAHQVYVYPATIRLPSTQVGLMRDLEGISSKRIVTDDLSFHAIRDYTPGDSQRHIHWKSTAKTGALMVRQYDQTVRSELMVVLDNDINSYLDEDEFELAVSCAASFAIQGITEGRHLFMVSGPQSERALAVMGGKPFVMATTSRKALLDDMARLRSLERGEPLDQICAHAASEADMVSIAVLVSGSRANLKEFQSAALRFPPQVGVMAVRCDVESPPRLNMVGETAIATVAVLDDLRHVLIGRAKK